MLNLKPIKPKEREKPLSKCMRFNKNLDDSDFLRASELSQHPSKKEVKLNFSSSSQSYENAAKTIKYKFQFETEAEFLAMFESKYNELFDKNVSYCVCVKICSSQLFWKN